MSIHPASVREYARGERVRVISPTPFIGVDLEGRVALVDNVIRVVNTGRPSALVIEVAAGQFHAVGVEYVAPDG